MDCIGTKVNIYMFVDSGVFLISYLNQGFA